MGFETVACDYCASRSHIRLFDIHESPDVRQPVAWRGTAAIPVVRCQQCGLVFLNPRYDDAHLTALYQDPQTFISTIDPEGKRRSISTERAQRVARFYTDVIALQKKRLSGRLLDVGCGLGFFLEAIGEKYNATGLEWSHPAIEMSGGLQLNIVEDRFPSHPFANGEFDIVTFHNTLDHLPAPIGSLQVAHNLLKKGGLLMLTLVNFNSIAARVYGPGYRLLGVNHLYYFTPATLKNAFKRVGFHLENIEYPYFGSDVSHPVEHTRKIISDWLSSKFLRRKEVRTSPPFYGNMMRVFAVSI